MAAIFKMAAKKLRIVPFPGLGANKAHYKLLYQKKTVPFCLIFIKIMFRKNKMATIFKMAALNEIFRHQRSFICLLPIKMLHITFTLTKKL